MEKLYTVDELAELFGLSTGTVRDLCRRYTWPHVKLGRAIRFTEEQVQEIVSIHTIEVSAEARRISKLMARGVSQRSAQYHVRRRGSRSTRG